MSLLEHTHPATQTGRADGASTRTLRPGREARRAPRRAGIPLPGVAPRRRSGPDGQLLVECAYEQELQVEMRSCAATWAPGAGRVGDAGHSRDLRAGGEQRPSVESGAADDQRKDADPALSNLTIAPRILGRGVFVAAPGVALVSVCHPRGRRTGKYVAAATMSTRQLRFRSSSASATWIESRVAPDARSCAILRLRRKTLELLAGTSPRISCFDEPLDRPSSDRRRTASSGRVAPLDVAAGPGDLRLGLSDGPLPVPLRRLLHRRPCRRRCGGAGRPCAYHRSGMIHPPRMLFMEVSAKGRHHRQTFVAGNARSRCGALGGPRRLDFAQRSCRARSPRRPRARRAPSSSLAGARDLERGRCRRIAVESGPSR